MFVKANERQVPEPGERSPAATQNDEINKVMKQ
jgi:hypothetical protein